MSPLGLSYTSVMERAIPILYPGGHDLGPARVDLLGVFYIVLACLWTIFIGWGIGLLYLWRDHEVVRIRGIWLPITSIVVLHVYAVLVILVYPWNGAFKCGAEFWLMSIFLPFGMALFQGILCKRNFPSTQS
jgi:hypothetical protein